MRIITTATLCAFAVACDGASEVGTTGAGLVEQTGGGVDRTSMAGVVLSAQGANAQSGEVVTNLVDDDLGTKWLDFPPTSWVQVDFGGTAAGAYAVTSYSLSSANDHPQRDPMDWTLAGSATGQSGSWTTLDTRSNETFSSRLATRTFSISAPASFRYYRLTATSAAGVQGSWSEIQLAELELIEASSSPPPPPPPPPSSGDVTSGAAVVAQGENSGSGEVASNLVDDDPQTKWLDFATQTWVQVDAGTAYTLTGYSLTSANDAPERDPRNWTLSGSNDGSQWSALDSRTGVDFPNRFQTRTYSIAPSTAYRYYRFDITNDAGTRGQWAPTQFAELELLAGSSGATCGDGTCNGSEDSNSCPADCGPPPPTCGDGTCNGSEDSSSCPADCGPPPPTCGDGTCNGSEDSNSCPADCGPPPPVCGDGQVGTGEVCDGGSRSCTAGSGYPGTQNCNSSCSGYGSCSSSLSCGDGVCTASVEDASSCPQDCSSGGAPVYSGGACPTLFEGMNNNFFVPNANTSLPTRPGGDVRYRDFEIRFPANPNGAPVIFTWHWYGGNSSDAINWLGLGNVGWAENVILVSFVAVAETPTNDTGYYEWFSGANPVGNPDIEVAEEVLACLYAQHNVDLDRIYATGHSAGAIWVSYLLQHWSHRLAAAMPLSGGEQYISSYRPPSDRSQAPYMTPSRSLPVMVVHGGSSDTYTSPYHATLNFQQASTMLASDLVNDGSSVVICNGGFGHQIPPHQGATTTAEYLIWPYFLDHPRTGTPYSSASEFPTSFPSGWCSMY